MTTTGMARYQQRAVDPLAVQALGLPPDALEETCQLATAGDFDWVLFYPEQNLTLWCGPDGLTSFPADSLVDALQRIATGNTD